MYYYNNWSIPAIVYLALHGTYGIIWLLKDKIIPDSARKQKATSLSILFISISVLGPYWIAPYLLITRKPIISNWVILSSIGIHTLGCVLMMASDTQKYWILKYQRGLISNGWFSRCRNTNYYQQLLDLPIVILLHPSIKSNDVLKRCSMVLTINGSSGFEAAFYGKPCIVFSDTSYSHLSFVHRINGIEELPSIIQKFLKIEVNLDELNQFVNDFDNSTFAFDEFKFEQEIFDRIHNGFLIGDTISMDDLNSFFEENRQVLEKVTVKHINKMTQYSEDTKIK